jgi:hypothetical protein
MNTSYHGVAIKQVPIKVQMDKLKLEDYKEVQAVKGFHEEVNAAGETV